MRQVSQILLFVILVFILQSCINFSESYTNLQLSADRNLYSINGQYKIKPLKSNSGDTIYLDFNNAFEKFYRGKGRGSRDTLKIDDTDRYSFKISVYDRDRIEVIYFKDSIQFKNFYIRYKFKKDGFMYLKNKNTKIMGVPYLFGGIDIKKLRLSVIDNNLLVEEVYHSSGAVLFIFGDSKTWETINQYERIK